MLKKPYTLLSEELLFIIYCSKLNISKQEKKFIEKYLRQDHTNFNKLLKLILKQGVLPLVYKTIKQENFSINHKSFNTFYHDLKSYYIQISKKNILMSAELIKIDTIAKENNISLIHFKGPALAKLAYKDITLRQFSDLDILIHQSQFRKLSNTMIHKKYHPYYPIDKFKYHKVMFKMNNDCPFYHLNRKIAIELHWDFFRNIALPTSKFHPWKHTKTISINHYTFTTLTNEVHLLYHTLHGSKHLWERIEWILDIDRFIRNVPNLDWNKMLTLSDKMGARRMFLLGLALTHKYFQTPLPQHIDILLKNYKFQIYINDIELEFNKNSEVYQNNLIKLKKIIGLRDNLYYKSATLFEFLFKPGINERRIIILPDYLFWLYWILRPIGGILRFIFCRTLKFC